MGEAISKSKDLEKELTHTKCRLAQVKMKALELSKEIYKTPKRSVYSVAKVSSLQFNVRSKPTASSSFCPRSHVEILQASVKIKLLDRYSLKSPRDASTCDLGSGAFGKCTKMLLCATEVAVKMITLEEYSYDSIMYEAAVMMELCCGHPNLPLFIGVYDQPEYPKPLIVMKFYSVAGKPCTFHDYIRKERLSSEDWARILLRVCNGLAAIHQKSYLHNDLKCDNIVLSDCIPNCKKPPPVWPIIIDFGKARTIKNAKIYRLNEVEKKEYLKYYTHLAPELVLGSCPQSVLTDIYSLCQIVGKVASISRDKHLKAIAKFCVKNNPANRPSLLYVHDSIYDLT